MGQGGPRATCRKLPASRAHTHCRALGHPALRSPLTPVPFQMRFVRTETTSWAALHSRLCFSKFTWFRPLASCHPSPFLMLAADMPLLAASDKS